MSLSLRILLALAWLTLVGAGFGFVWRYESTPGRAAAKSNWPSPSKIDLDPVRPTVVMFAHPLCPCTKAGLDGLAELLKRRPDRARLVFVAVQPSGLPKTESPTVRQARTIEGAVVMADPSGLEAKRFGAATSGQVVVFDSHGEQLFRGGLTDRRGHLGPNPGLDAVESILDAKTPKVGSTPVYGCSLMGDTERGASR